MKPKEILGLLSNEKKQEDFIEKINKFRDLWAIVHKTADDDHKKIQEILLKIQEDINILKETFQKKK